MATIEDDPIEDVEWTTAPIDRPHTVIDVRECGPPIPLKQTLETLVDLDEDQVVIQINDRVPQHLYPQLEDRGYQYETVETATTTITAIWTP